MFKVNMIRNLYIFQCLVMTPRKMLLEDVRPHARKHRMRDIRTLSRHDCTAAKVVLFDDIGVFKISGLGNEFCGGKK
jgi:hypothetical protein